MKIFVIKRLCNLSLIKRLAPSIRYLLTNATREVPNFIRYLAVPIMLFPLISAEAERMFSQLTIVKTKLFTQMSQDFF